MIEWILLFLFVHYDAEQTCHCRVCKCHTGVVVCKDTHLFVFSFFLSCSHDGGILEMTMLDEVPI